jgi:hypothetical protein
MDRPDRNADRVRLIARARRKRLGLLAMGAVMLCSPVLAEDQAAAAPGCHLSRVASLPMTALSDGQLGVKVILAGKEQMLALGISDPFSFLYESYVKAQGLPTEHMSQYDVGVDIGNAHAKLVATLPEIKIGAIAGKDKRFAEFNDAIGRGNGTVGELALDILAGFDVDIDFDTMTLNLFLQDHCPGQVVYWAEAYAAVPFKTDETGHPSVKMQLDGKPLTVAFSLNAGPGFMAMATAKRLFDIDQTTRDVKSGGPEAGSEPVRYRYPFKELTIEGVTVNNPVINLDPDAKDCRAVGTWKLCYGGSDLQLGIEEMKRLHLYFAFKEKKLYVTAAGADRAKDQPSGAPAQLGKPK